MHILLVMENKPNQIKTLDPVIECILQVADLLLVVILLCKHSWG